MCIRYVPSLWIQFDIVNIKLYMQLDHDKKQLKCTFLSLRNIVIVHCSQIYNSYLHAIVKYIKKLGTLHIETFLATRV